MIPLTTKELQNALGQRLLHRLAQPAEQGFQPAHRGFAGPEYEVVDAVEHQQQKGRTQHPVGQHPVHLVGKIHPHLYFAAHRLAGDAGDKAVAVVRHYAFGVIIQGSLEMLAQPS
jgi:hypothetical protein